MFWGAFRPLLNVYKKTKKTKNTKRKSEKTTKKNKKKKETRGTVVPKLYSFIVHSLWRTMSGGVAVVIYSFVSCRPEHNTLPPTPTPPPSSIKWRLIPIVYGLSTSNPLYVRIVQTKQQPPSPQKWWKKSNQKLLIDIFFFSPCA